MSLCSVQSHNLKNSPHPIFCLWCIQCALWCAFTMSFGHILVSGFIMLCINQLTFSDCEMEDIITVKSQKPYIQNWHGVWSFLLFCYSLAGRQLREEHQTCWNHMPGHQGGTVCWQGEMFSALYCTDGFQNKTIIVCLVWSSEWE